MHSNAQTVMAITKQTLISVHSKSTDSIMNSTAKNKLKSMKTEINQFT